MVACDIADTFIAEMYDYYVYNTMVLDILIAIIYIFVWVAIKKNIQGFFYGFHVTSPNRQFALGTIRLRVNSPNT